MKKVEAIVAKTDGMESFQTVIGLGIVTNTYQPNYGTIFMRLKPWEERKDPKLKVKGIMASLQKQFAAIPEAIVFPFNIPTLSGFGASAGFNFLLQDRSGSMTVQQLGEQTQKFMAAGRQRPELANLNTSFDPNYPQIKVSPGSREGAHAGRPGERSLPVDVRFLGGAFVNDFNRFGRLYRVYVQADSGARLKPEDIGKIYVKSKTTSEMIPLSTLVTVNDVSGTEITTRFNLLRSVEITGIPGSGYTSGQAMKTLEEVFAQTMPKEMSFAYTQLSYQEKVAPPSAPTLILAIVAVFLLLAALYESWKLPWAVLLGSPLVALGAFFGVWLMGMDNNVYVQVGLIMLIGLAAKNAILIVEFAKAKQDEGMSVEDAALDSARLRFRPILMTAFAFILGVVPLMRSSGAGSGAQNVMGTAVFWGMLVATFLGVLIIPGNFTFMQNLNLRFWKKKPVAAEAVPEPVPVGEWRWTLVKQRLSVSALIIVLLGNLALGQQKVYQPPAPQTPTVFRADDATSQPGTQSFGDLQWFEVFKDEQLQVLIRTAIAQNYDVRQAVARINAARAQLGLARADQYPNFAVSGSVVTTRLPKDGSIGELAEGTQRNISFGQVLLNLLNFELDFWGRVRKIKNARNAELKAAEEDRYFVLATVVSTVATAYFQLRELDLELDISKRTLATRQESLRIIKLRADAGIATSLDLRQAEQLVFAASATIPDLERAIEQQENLINLLLGQNPAPDSSRPGAGCSGPHSDCAPGPAFVSFGTPARYSLRRGEFGGDKLQR